MLQYLLWKLGRFCSAKKQKCSILSNFRGCKRAHNAMRPKPAFDPNWPSEMLENTEGTFCWKILKNADCRTCLISRYIKVKESKFMIKPNTRSKLGRKTACQASECRLLSTVFYGADNCAVPPYNLLLLPPWWFWRTSNLTLATKEIEFVSHKKCKPYQEVVNGW